MKKYKIITLGCRTNQFESSCLERCLTEAGYVRGEKDDAFDVVVVNTCTVTHRADKQSRQSLRRAVRENSGARVVATGCLAQLESGELAGIEGVDLVLGHADQARLAEFLVPQKGQIVHDESSLFDDFGPAPLQGRSRALLKVQDGCNNSCSYCRVTHARGRSRSLGLDRVLETAKELDTACYQEIVLTGIHLGFYGLDLDPKVNLTALVAAMLDDGNDYRLRLSSLEPTEVTHALLAKAVESDRFCPHFHLPLQSGDASVLKAMGRHYDPQTYLSVIEKLMTAMPNCAIGADVMVGFPGEDDRAFQNGFDLIEKAPLAYLHVFPYSPRPGTKAAKMPHRPASAPVTARAGQLRELGRIKKETYLKRFVGRSLSIIVESRRHMPSGLLTGLSSNYAAVLVDGPDGLMNRLVEVEITDCRDGVLIGRLK